VAVCRPCPSSSSVNVLFLLCKMTVVPLVTVAPLKVACELPTPDTPIACAKFRVTVPSNVWTRPAWHGQRRRRLVNLNDERLVRLGITASPWRDRSCRGASAEMVKGRTAACTEPPPTCTPVNDIVMEATPEHRRIHRGERDGDIRVIPAIAVPGRSRARCRDWRDSGRRSPYRSLSLCWPTP